MINSYVVKLKIELWNKAYFRLVYQWAGWLGKIANLDPDRLTLKILRDKNISSIVVDSYRSIFCTLVVLASSHTPSALTLSLISEKA